MNDSRFPYTYAADFIRQFGPVSSEGVVLSRSNASQIRQAIANALGIDDEKLASQLANAYLNQDPEFENKQAKRLWQAMFSQQLEGNS